MSGSLFLFPVFLFHSLFHFISSFNFNFQTISILSFNKQNNPSMMWWYFIIYFIIWIISTPNLWERENNNSLIRNWKSLRLLKDFQLWLLVLRIKSIFDKIKKYMILPFTYFQEIFTNLIKSLFICFLVSSWILVTNLTQIFWTNFYEIPKLGFWDVTSSPQHILQNLIGSLCLAICLRVVS